MEIDIGLVNEISDVVNNKGASCVVNHLYSGTNLYELRVMSHILFLYREETNEPICYLLSMTREHTGGAARRSAMKRITKEGEDCLIYGFLEGIGKTPVVVKINDLKGVFPELYYSEEGDWHKWNKNQNWPEDLYGYRKM